MKIGRKKKDIGERGMGVKLILKVVYSAEIQVIKLYTGRHFLIFTILLKNLNKT